MLDITPQHDYLVGIDSDGCVFDSMELKHKECFIPAFINHYGLQGVSKMAREAAEFVNLYSKSRGANRFPALVEQLDWLRRRPDVKARGVKVPKPQGSPMPGRWQSTRQLLTWCATYRPSPPFGRASNYSRSVPT
jgi:hypothetical protein